MKRDASPSGLKLCFEYPPDWLHAAQVEEYEEALKLAVHGNVVEAKEKLQQLLGKPPLLLLTGAVGSASVTALTSAGTRAAGRHRPQGSTFLQLRYLSLNNLAALEGDDHRRVRAWLLHGSVPPCRRL